MALPTLAQEDYAKALIERLEEESMHIDAGRFGRSVLQCQDRQQMSQLIDEMKRLIGSLDKE